MGAIGTLMKKKVVPKLWQEVKVDIVTSDDIKIYYTGKFQDFTARYIITKHKKFKHWFFSEHKIKNFLKVMRWPNVRTRLHSMCTGQSTMA